MNEETIPLFDGELSGSRVIHQEDSHSTESSLHCRRGGVRKAIPRVVICFSPELPSERIDHAECPVVNISQGGFAVEYDAPLPIGTLGSVCYRSDSGRPVHITCAVRWCRPQDDGSFQIGLRLDRKLKLDEAKPARVAVGREVAPGFRMRKLAGKSKLAHS